MATTDDSLAGALDVIRCQYCIGKDRKCEAQKVCKTCHVYLCTGCEDIHTIDPPLPPRHDIVTLRFHFYEAHLLQCKLHEDLICDMFCRDCDSEICVTCLFSGFHKSHSIEPKIKQIPCTVHQILKCDVFCKECDVAVCKICLKSGSHKNHNLLRRMRNHGNVMQRNISSTEFTGNKEAVDQEQAKEKVEDKKDFKRRLHDVEEGIFPVTKEDLERKKKGRRKKRKEEDKDEVDTVSVWSYFMPKRNFQYFFQHPYLRIFIAFFVIFCNYLIYGGDPVAQSMRECSIPLLGNDIAFVATRYAPNAWSFLKVFLWLSAIVLGMLIGKLVVHGLFFNRLCRLRMFEDDMGSFLVMFLTTLISVFIFSWIYNAFLMIGGSDTEDYRISDLIGIRNSTFMYWAYSYTCYGHLFIALVVIHMMLQEKLYPKWAVGARRLWNKWNICIKMHCLCLTFAVIITLCVIALVITHIAIQRNKPNLDFLYSNELSRAILASFILVMDILIVQQDWDFTRFVSSMDIKLPFSNKREAWQVRMKGKWNNYGILFLVMILDMNVLKNQIFYYPFNYGQYTDSDGRIYSVKDDYSLKTFNETQLSYSYRSITINPNTQTTYLAGDTVLNARYNGYHIAIKLVAFVPAVVAFVTFGVLLWKFGRSVPHDKYVYAGRLKKRRRDGTKVRFNRSEDLLL